MAKSFALVGWPGLESVLMTILLNVESEGRQSDE
jgi:hypothetical protein